MRDDLRLPALLVIMDGFGIEKPGPGNAISLAKTPYLDEIKATNPRLTLDASGEEVGLPAGQMGNSEVGHLNIGAGRVVDQELTRINKACRWNFFADEQEWFEEAPICKNAALNEAIDAVLESGGTLHLMGLVSNGGVHSSNEHLYALVRLAHVRGVSNVRVHCFMDGRDVPPTSGKGFIEELESSALNDTNWLARIATVSGRYYAMDRDNRWDRVKRAWDAIVHAQPVIELKAADYIQASYDAGVTDEFIEPAAMQYDQRGISPAYDGMHDGDAVVFFNFRPDRARQLSHAFLDDDFDGFDRGERPNVHFVCLTEYDEALDAPVAFPKEFPQNVLADVLSNAGLRQYHIAETEKYAHVTFFLNGGIEAEKAGEKRVLIPSPKVATYDLQPQMSAPEVADTLAAAIRNDEADVYIVNFANCDMVGHTGIIPAAVAAVEAVDAAVHKVVDAAVEKGGFALITADHGNADKMLAADGSPHTAHTTARVPFVLVDSETGEDRATLKTGNGALCDIAPTLLDILGLEAPSEMTGRSLLAHEGASILAGVHSHEGAFS